MDFPNGSSLPKNLVAKDSVTTIELPPNLTLRFIPESLSSDTPWQKLTQDYAFKDNKIIITSKGITKKDRITSEEYPQFKKALEDWAERSKQCIILEEVGSPRK